MLHVVAKLSFSAKHIQKPGARTSSRHFWTCHDLLTTRNRVRRTPFSYPAALSSGWPTKPTQESHPSTSYFHPFYFSNNLKLIKKSLTVVAHVLANAPGNASVEGLARQTTLGFSLGPRDWVHPVPRVPKILRPSTLSALFHGFSMEYIL